MKVSSKPEAVQTTKPAFQRRGFTFDRGMAMACDPHAPWQQGSNENTNGQLRQFLPKGADLRQFSQQDLDHIADLRHDRPRKPLEWKTPDQALAEEIANAAKNCAIGT